jgi:hypothetical protein
MEDSQPLPPPGAQIDAQLDLSTTSGDEGPAEVKAAWYWIKGSDGNGSVSATLVFVSFWATTLAYVLSIVGSVGPVTFRPFDIPACSVYFTPILALYFGRRWTAANSKSSPSGGA